MKPVEFSLGGDYFEEETSVPRKYAINNEVIQKWRRIFKDRKEKDKNKRIVKIPK
jgi:hypothetical protein